MDKDKAQIKRKFTKEHLSNLSMSHIGQIVWNKGLAGKGICKPTVGSFKKGYKMSDETRKKISAGHKGIKQSKEWINNRIDNKGNKHWNWKGGITPALTKVRFSKEGKNWIKQCMVRDDFTCKKCGVHNGLGKTIYLQVHHIYNFSDCPELRFVSSNGVTFCRACHKEFHSIYGIKHNSEIQLQEFLNK